MTYSAPLPSARRDAQFRRTPPPPVPPSWDLPAAPRTPIPGATTQMAPHRSVDLPQPFLQSLFAQLPLEDYFNAQQVSRAWRQVGQDDRLRQQALSRVCALTPPPGRMGAAMAMVIRNYHRLCGPSDEFAPHSPQTFRSRRRFPIDHLAISPCGRYAATQQRRQTIQLWDLQPKVRRLCRLSPFESVGFMEFSADSRALVAGDERSLRITTWKLTRLTDRVRCLEGVTRTDLPPLGPSVPRLPALPQLRLEGRWADVFAAELRSESLAGLRAHGGPAQLLAYFRVHKNPFFGDPSTTSLMDSQFTPGMDKLLAVDYSGRLIVWDTGSYWAGRAYYFGT